MTPEDFRRMALKLPEATESSHMGHPDFRVGGKIFATLGHPDASWAMVKLTPDEQELFVQIDPGAFRPVPGGWGRQGATQVRLPSAQKGAAREALLVAWRHRAPNTLAKRASDRPPRSSARRGRKKATKPKSRRDRS